MKKFLSVSLFTFLLLLFNIPVHAAIYYVDDDAAGSDTGQNWANAFLDLQDALDDASLDPDVVVEIWVAEGTYYPSSGATRYKTFEMISGVSIYGGFDGTEISVDQRDIKKNPTILSGDIGIPNDSSDNCYHVFYHPAGTNLDETAVLDGFTITGGNANDVTDPHRRGGGMHNHSSSPTLKNCIFYSNTSS